MLVAHIASNYVELVFKYFENYILFDYKMRKTVVISIDQDQYDWLKENYMNISSFVRAQIKNYRDKNSQ